MSDYPEHEKLKAIADKSQAVYDFIEWCSYEKSIHLAEHYCLRDSHPDHPGCEEGECEMSSYMVGTFRSIDSLLAEFFQIDMQAIDREKRAMLESIREAHP